MQLRDVVVLAPSDSVRPAFNATFFNSASIQQNSTKVSSGWGSKEGLGKGRNLIPSLSLYIVQACLKLNIVFGANNGLWIVGSRGGGCARIYVVDNVF
jgi:hypothetical protein